MTFNTTLFEHVSRWFVLQSYYCARTFHIATMLYKRNQPVLGLYSRDLCVM